MSRAPARPKAISYFSEGSERRQYQPPPVVINPHVKYPSRVRNTRSASDYGTLSSPSSAFTGRRSRSSTVGSYSAPAQEDDDDYEDAEESRFWAERVFFRPRRRDVKKVVRNWASRWTVMCLVPVAVVVGWCAIPFPHRPIEEGDEMKRKPGHGEPTSVLNFWFFLGVYYGFYNLVGLFWITKLFNLYSLNWWPARLGLFWSYAFFWSLSLLISIPIYLWATVLTQYNIVWILLTFFTMCCPLLVAFFVIRSSHKHRATGYVPSETQALFTAAIAGESTRGRGGREQYKESYLPRSYMRFLWFCAALGISLLALVLGEAYAEIYLSSLPHNTMETIVYVYSWTITIHILDLLTGWILGAQVDSYPLGMVFKLYFLTTYQTFVRALYARLRSPSQFAYLQLLSSTLTIIVQPTTMHPLFHRAITYLGFTDSSYRTYLKFSTRSLFLRPLAESVTMLAFLSWVAVLHYGPNRAAYPYFDFPDVDDGSGNRYTFKLTFWASGIVWACEIVAGWVTRRAVGWLYGVRVTEEGVRDLEKYPELVVACVVVMMHCLQNMLFGIVSLKFWG